MTFARQTRRMLPLHYVTKWQMRIYICNTYVILCFFSQRNCLCKYFRIQEMPDYTNSSSIVMRWFDVCTAVLMFVACKCNRIAEWFWCRLFSYLYQRFLVWFQNITPIVKSCSWAWQTFTPYGKVSSPFAVFARCHPNCRGNNIIGDF